MRRKPCWRRECNEWCAEKGVSGPTPPVCYQCGFEGPMCDWYIERDQGEEEKRWLEEQREAGV